MASIESGSAAIEPRESRDMRAHITRSWVAIVVLGALAAYLALAPMRPGGRPLEILVQVLYLVPYVVAFVLSVLAARNAGGVERHFWTLLAIVTGCLIVSETTYSVATVTGGSSPSWLILPAVLDVVAAVLFVPLFLAMSHTAGTPVARRIRYVTDILLLGVFGFLFLTFGVIEPLFGRGGMTLGEAATESAYATFGGLLIVGSLLMIPSIPHMRRHAWERLVVVGIGIYGLATLLSPLWHAAVEGLTHAAWVPVIEGLWMLGFAFVAIGAAHRLASPASTMVPRTRRLANSRYAEAAPMLITLAALIAMPLLIAIGSGLIDRDVKGAAQIVTSAATVIAVLLAVRMGALGVEYGYMADRAETDPLTGLGNHRALRERLRAELETAVHRGGSTSVVALDIDGFRRVNALLGHQGGDALLRDIARRLSALVGDGGSVARPSADEFVAVLPGVSSSAARSKAAAMRAEVLAASAGVSLPLTASIGIATFPDHGLDADELLRHADGAQFWAKCEGRDQIVVYDPAVVVALDADERLRLQESESHLRTARALAAAVDARDHDTQYHSTNVAQLSAALGEALGLEPEHVRSIELAASLHDIGKIGVADSVLLKRGPLTRAERKHIEQHPELAERILASTTMTQVLPWIRHHHERWDGSGYPDGLRAHEIPLESRMLGVCDSYDSMVSERPYRPRMSSQAALQEIDLNLGILYDPMVGEAFIRLMSERIAAQREEVSEGRSFS